MYDFMGYILLLGVIAALIGPLDWTFFLLAGVATVVIYLFSLWREREKRNN
jgi:membrane protein implicated in regulation of membrane protease activity